jgi:hypothetical protein
MVAGYRRKPEQVGVEHGRRCGWRERKSPQPFEQQQEQPVRALVFLSYTIGGLYHD